jgi:hypothetical protein
VGVVAAGSQRRSIVSKVKLAIRLSECIDVEAKGVEVVCEIIG